METVGGSLERVDGEVDDRSEKRGTRHSNGRAITVSLRGKEKCSSGSLQSPRGGANGSCQTLIFRFTRLDPRSTSTLHPLACSFRPGKEKVEKEEEKKKKKRRKS